MLEKFKYINHLGEELIFGEFPLFAKGNELRNFEWKIKSKNNKITSFERGIVSKSIPLIIKCRSKNDGYAIRNRLFEVFEKDRLAMKYGKIVIGDYYLKCFVTASNKTDYLISKDYMQLKITVETDLPEWVKETTIFFRANPSGGTSFLDFPYDFSYDLKNDLVSGEVVNTNFVASNFRMTIYGVCINPTIYIGGHEYSVDVDIGNGEFLTIDSVEKTIVLTKVNGEKVNCFNKRNKDSYVFEKIPTGTNITTAPNEGISFDITLLEERSEPKWT